MADLADHLFSIRNVIRIVRKLIEKNKYQLAVNAFLTELLSHGAEMHYLHGCDPAPLNNALSTANKLRETENKGTIDDFIKMLDSFTEFVEKKYKSQTHLV